MHILHFPDFLNLNSIHCEHFIREGSLGWGPGGVSDVGSELKVLGLSFPICAVRMIVSIILVPLEHFQGLGNQNNTLFLASLVLRSKKT